MQFYDVRPTENCLTGVCGLLTSARNFENNNAIMFENHRLSIFRFWKIGVEFTFGTLIKACMSKVRTIIV